MASIYFYYNELLQQSAQAASARATASASPVRDAEPQEPEPHQEHEHEHEHEGEDKPAGDAHGQEHDNQQDDRPRRGPVSRPATTTATPLPRHSDAERAALQPRLNKLAYLQTAVAANLDALARALGPKQ